MKLNQSIDLLNKYGFTDWIANDIDTATRLFINATVEYHLGDWGGIN